MPAVGSNVVQARNGGSWKNWSGFWARHSGSWKKPLGVWVRRSGSWVKVWDERPTLTVTGYAYQSSAGGGVIWTNFVLSGTVTANGFETTLTGTHPGTVVIAWSISPSTFSANTSASYSATVSVSGAWNTFPTMTATNASGSSSATVS